MNIFKMTTDELRAASRDLGELVTENLDDRPEAVKVIVDAMELICKELLVRTIGGDRELADKIHGKMHAERGN